MKFLLFLSLLWCSANCIYLINETKADKNRDNPAIWTEEGLWGPLLEEWALTGNRRNSRVMQLPPAKDAYVMDEVTNNNSTRDDKKGKVNPGKIIVNPSPAKPPGRQVSETDLYLLGAIEKLVYRADFMEKRLRRVEEMLYYVTAGNRVDQEPCPGNFTRVASSCYYFHYSAGREYDWKASSKLCKRLGAALAELETIEENQDIVAHIQNNQYLRGKDFWTGGLNPGLLWIWSNSARPVNSNKPADIPGDGRCLRLAYNPGLRSYSYKGSDCGLRYNYICELPETTSSNEIKRIGRSRGIFDE